MTNYDRWLLYTQDLESPLIFIRWGFIHMIASALQRKVWLRANRITELPDHNSIFSNLYSILIGPPATGKGRTIKQVLSVILHPLMTTVDKDGRIIQLIKTSPSKVTCQRIIELLSKEIRSAEYKSSNGEKRITAHCSCSFNIEELEVLFSRDMADMVAVLNDLYDAGNLSYETRHQGVHHIKNVCVNMLAGTTPNSIRDLLADRVVKKGFTSRTIMIYADGARFFRAPRELSPEQQQAYVEIVAHVKEIATRVVGEVTLSPEAEHYFNTMYESGDMIKHRVNKNPRLDDYYGRKKIHWLKLMTILHYAERYDTNVISIATAKEAFDTLGEAEVNMHLAFANSGRNVLHESGNDIVRYLAEQGESTTSFKRLQLQFGNDLKKTELMEVMESLVATDRAINTNPQTQNIDRGTFRISKSHHEALQQKQQATAIPPTITPTPSVVTIVADGTQVVESRATTTSTSQNPSPNAASRDSNSAS